MAADDRHALEDGDLKAVGMLGKGCGAGLDMVSRCMLLEGSLLTMPAAPPPTITTRFLPPFLRESVDDMAGREKDWVCWRVEERRWDGREGRHGVVEQGATFLSHDRGEPA